MRTLAKIYIYTMMAIAGLAMLSAFGYEFDGYAFWGGVAYLALGVIAIRFINITETYERKEKALAEAKRINDLVDQKLQERQ